VFHPLVGFLQLVSKDGGLFRLQHRGALIRRTEINPLQPEIMIQAIKDTRGDAPVLDGSRHVFPTPRVTKAFSLENSFGSSFRRCTPLVNQGYLNGKVWCPLKPYVALGRASGTIRPYLLATKGRMLVDTLLNIRLRG
jgi:hypothetical protein